MPDIDATVSGPTANSYLTLEEADERMIEFVHHAKWDELKKGNADREVLLIRAARMIDRYKAWPPRPVEGQARAFPTTKDRPGVIPEQVKTAVLEIIDHLLDGSLVPLKRLQAEGVTSMSILGQSVNVSDFATSPMDRTQIPAPARLELDRLWASYQTPIVQGRAYDGSDDEDGSSLFG